MSEADRKSIEYRIKEIYENETKNRNQLPSSSSSSMSSNSPTIASNWNSVRSRNKPKKKLSAIEDFLQSIGEIVVTEEEKSGRAVIVEEIHNYRSLMIKFIKNHTKKAMSCFTFWQTYEFTLPFLFSLAKRYLCTPATSVPSESAFSISSYVARKERSRLSAQNLEMTMFLKVRVLINVSRYLLSAVKYTVD